MEKKFDWGKFWTALGCAAMIINGIATAGQNSCKLQKTLLEDKKKGE